MPSELMASPEGHHATTSATSIDFEDITRAKEATAYAATSVIDDAVSQSASASVSANVVMNEMVDKIVGSEATNESEYRKDAAAFRAPPTPPSYSFEDSPVKTGGNDTSYGLLGTSTAQEFLNDSRFATPHQPSPYETPGPLLPSIYNSVFALTPDEVSSRPSTAKGLSPPRLPGQPSSSDYLVQSNFSVMPALSSVIPSHTPPFVKRNNNGDRRDLTYGTALAPMTALTYSSPCQ